MKKLPTLLLITGLTFNIFAQAPQMMSYQCVIRNSAGDLITGQSVGIRISILRGSTSGSVVFSETYDPVPVTNGNGLVTIQIGNGIPSTGIFSEINWSDGPYFIKTETDPDGGTNYTITGVTQLLRVPYSLHSKTAETAITETDPVFSGSAAGGITASDITEWNNKLEMEIDGDPQNELQDFANVLDKGNNANGKNIISLGKIGVGTSDPVSGAAVDISSATGALLLPRMTTSQRNSVAPVKGMLIYNTDTDKFQGYSRDSISKIDQQHLTINNAGGENRAQSFTAGESGKLIGVEIPLITYNNLFQINIAIRDGAGTAGTILHSQTFAIPATPVWTWYSFNITGVNVIAGNSYTIHVTELNPGSCGMGPCYNWGMDTSGDNYPGGQFYYNGTPYLPSCDCAFKTYIKEFGDTWVDLN